MSEIEAFSTPTIKALPVSVSETGWPLVALIPSLLPSIFSTVPRKRWVCGCWAEAVDTAKAATKAAAVKMRSVVMVSPQKQGAETIHPPAAKAKGLSRIDPAQRGLSHSIRHES